MKNYFRYLLFGGEGGVVIGGRYLLGKVQVECYFAVFPKGEIILGIFEIFGNSLKSYLSRWFAEKIKLKAIILIHLNLL